MDKQNDAQNAKRQRRIKHERSAGGLVLRRANGSYEGLLIGRATPEGLRFDIVLQGSNQTTFCAL